MRQLLQHTSGLPEYTDAIATSIFEVRDEYHSPRDFLDAALARPAAFQPGEKFAYTNTNYIVLGLLIEKVTKRTLGEQIDQRIVQPLSLLHTYLPAPGIAPSMANTRRGMNAILSPVSWRTSPSRTHPGPGLPGP